MLFQPLLEADGRLSSILKLLEAALGLSPQAAAHPLLTLQCQRVLPHLSLPPKRQLLKVRHWDLFC